MKPKLFFWRKPTFLPSLFTLVLGLAFNLAMGQSAGTITGKITGITGDPISGATVTVKNTSNAVSTDPNGEFSIKAEKNATLIISYVGFETQEIALGGRSSLAIALKALNSPLDDVVVVAYGSQRKKDITGSVAIVNVDNAKKTASYDMAKQLQGQVAGVSVHGSGEPGGFVQIKIRGISTFGNNSPLFVIDGVPVDAPYDFAPGDIESMQILKDASAAALYGSRAATGVVIITTKKGKPGPLKVNYSGYYGWQKQPKKIPVTDREGYQKITNASELNAGLTIAPGNDPSSPNFISNINTDWQDEMFRVGKIQDHNLNFSGGNEAINYSVGLGFFDQNSTIEGPASYKRYTMNTNFGGKKGRFTYGGKIAYTLSDKNNLAITGDHAVFGGGVTSMVTAIPTMAVKDPNRLGGYGGSDELINRAISLNVIGMNKLVTDNSDRDRFFGNIFGELEIIKNLKYKLNVSYDKVNYKNYHYEPKFDMGFYYLNKQYILSENRGINNTGLIENMLTYNLQLGNHKIDFLAGMTYQEDNGEWTTGRATGTGDYEFYNFSSLPSADKVLFGEKYTSTLLSYLARINYNYDSRYLLTLNFRRDGSSRFSPVNRYGNFASIAGAWNLGNESFIHLPEIISSLKLRSGYGELGNQNFENYKFQSFINPNASYLFGNEFAPGSAVVGINDPSLKWEATKTFNAAIDLGMFRDRLLFTAEYFNRNSYDIITGIPIPLSVGSFPSNLVTNAASTNNRGVEFQLTYRKTDGAFTYDLNANASTLSNKVLKLGGTNNPIYGAGSKTEINGEVGKLFGFVTEGLFQSADEISKHAIQTNAGVGDVKFKDIDGNGRITDDDRTYLGSVIPNFYYGFTGNFGYRNFDASIFFQGSRGNKVFNGVYQALMAGQYGNHSTEMLDFWSPTNTQTNIPRPIKGDPNGNGRFSDRFVQDGSYLRLQTAQIGYNFPQTAITSKLFKSARVYVSGQNLLTITKYKGYDPDFISDGLFSRGFDYGSFPNPRTVMVGLQVGL